MALEYKIEKVFSNKEIYRDIYSLSIKGNFKVKPGQFYMLRAWEEEPILSRPISVQNVDEEKITFMYQVVGRGTEILARLKEGDEIKISGPFGNGFKTEEYTGKIAVVAGGIGVAPMNYLIKQLENCEVDLYTGFREESYALEGVKPIIKALYIATESGKQGYKGYVTDIFEPSRYDLVLCCGPEVMMKKVAEMCKEKEVPLFLSMEKHMACGIGACLVCTCSTTGGNKRTCKDGPIFNGNNVIF